MEEETNKKSRKKILIIVLTILVIVAIAATSVGYFLLRDKETQQIESEPVDENMQDLEAPIITGIEDKEITIGDEINLKDGITANDETDGEVETIIEGEVDINKAGEYTITVKATDKSGNTKEESFKVIVKEKSDKEEIDKKETDKNETDKKEQDKKQNTVVANKDTTTNTNKTTSSEKNNATTQTPQDNNQDNSTSTTTPNTPVEKPKLTGTDRERQLTNTETKYGVVINTYTTTVYNVYSDGSKTVKSTSNSTEYDKKNFSATTQELLPEARSVRSKNASMISKVVENTNSYRQEANALDGTTDRQNLVLDEQLCVAACVRAVEMVYANKFSHTRPNGSSCFTVATEMGIYARGENIAYGYGSADSASLGWKNSPGHYSNMINSDFTKIGVGVFKLDGTYYWVQLFG